MLDAVVAAAFEHVQEAGDVGVDIGVGVVEGIADARLRREVDDPLEALLGESGLDRRPVSKIGLDEAEAFSTRQAGKPRLFQRDVVIRA